VKSSAFPLNPNDVAILLIDFQEGVLELSKTVEPDRLQAAAVHLIKLARLFDIPVVVTTAMLDGPTRVTPEVAEVRHRLPTAKVSRKRRTVMGTDGSLGKWWESVSANNKENR